MFHVPLAPHLQSAGIHNPEYGVTEPLLREYETELERDRLLKAQEKESERALRPYAEIIDPSRQIEEGFPSAYPVLPSAVSLSPQPLPSSPQPLRQFQSNGGPQTESTSPSAGTQKKKQQSDFPPQVNDPTIRFIKVEVKPTDSVVSLAVRHGVSEAELRQYNRGLYIWSHCDFVDHVWVPQKVTRGETEAPSGDAAAEVNRKYFVVKQFIMLTSADESEAKFYLDECNWDVQRAVRNYEIDAAAVRNVQELRKLPSKSQPAPAPSPSPAPVPAVAETPDRRGSASQDKSKGFFSRLLDKKESPKAAESVKRDPHTGSTTVKFSSSILRNRKN